MVLPAIRNATRRFEGRGKELLYLGDFTRYKAGMAIGFILEALMTNAAPCRIGFHEAGGPATVCWRHDVGFFLPS